MSTSTPFSILLYFCVFYVYNVAGLVFTIFWLDPLYTIRNFFPTTSKPTIPSEATHGTVANIFPISQTFTYRSHVHKKGTRTANAASAPRPSPSTGPRASPPWEACRSSPPPAGGRTPLSSPLRAISTALAATNPSSWAFWTAPKRGAPLSSWS